MPDAITFLIVRPAERTVETFHSKDINDAIKAAGLKPMEVDHGVALHGIGIIVFEYSLFVPPETQHYFELGRRLYAGNAVLYGFNEGGETVDVPTPLPPPVFFTDHIDVENAIVAGLVQRPQMSVNGAIFWEWPNPWGLK